MEKIKYEEYDYVLRQYQDLLHELNVMKTNIKYALIGDEIFDEDKYCLLKTLINTISKMSTVQELFEISYDLFRTFDIRECEYWINYAKDVISFVNKCSLKGE